MTNTTNTSNMPKKLLLVSCMALVSQSFISHSYAQTNQAFENYADIVNAGITTDRQFASIANQQISQAQQQLNQLSSARIQQQLSKQRYQTEVSTNSDISNTDCLPYKSVVVIGATQVNTDRLLPKYGECISQARLNQLSKDITKAYLAKGYPKITLTPSTQKTTNGSYLQLLLNEVTVKNVTSKSELISTKTLLPNLVGKPLNIKDLDQGLDNTNQLRSNKVSADIYPNKDGTVDITLSNNSDGQISGFVQVDNSGADSTGEWMGKFGIYVDSPLHLVDSLIVTGGHSLKTLEKNEDDYSRNLAIDYSLPYGYWRAGVFGSLSQFENGITLENSGDHVYTGDTLQTGARVSRTLSRGANSVTTANASFEHVDTNTKFDTVSLANQSYITNSAKVGINHLQIFPSAVISASLDYEKGLSASTVNAELFDKNYDLISADVYANVNHATKFVDLNAPLQWRHSHSVQARFSDDELPTIKKSNLVTNSSVRGFDGQSFLSNKSLVSQNTLYVTKHLNKWRVEPYIGVDLGIQRVKEKTVSANGQTTDSANSSYNRWAIGAVTGIELTHLMHNKALNSAQADYRLGVSYATGRVQRTDEKQEEQSERDDVVSFYLKWVF